MSQLNCMSSANKLHRQKTGPWNLGERKQAYTCLGEGEGKRLQPASERVRAGEQMAWGEA